MTIANVKKRTINQRSEILEDIHDRHIHVDSREIFVSSYPDPDGDGEETGVDYRMSESFLKNLRYLEAHGDDAITVHFNTTGGDWVYGMAIYDAIAHSPCHVLSISHGWAVSMSSIMMQAADTRLLMPNCDFMIHGGSAFASGTTKQVITAAEWTVKINERMLDIYVKQCSNGAHFRAKEMDDAGIREFLNAKMDKKEEWWLTAKDAVYYGFADGLIGEGDYETIAKARESLHNV